MSIHTKNKSQPSYWTDWLDVSVYLFSRIVTNQVSSAQVSLTSVFGMGTGGPSPSSTLTILFAAAALICSPLGDFNMLPHCS